MKNNVITIMKKEFARFFKDKRMVLTTVLMPGILIYVMYTFMGQGMSGLYTSREDFVPQVYAVNLPEYYANAEEIPMNFVAVEEEGKAREMLTSGTGDEAGGCDLLVVFPENFAEATAAYEVSSGEKAPEVEVYYNSADTDSTTAYGMMTELLDAHESTMANKFDVNSQEKQYDLATEKDTAGMIFSMLIPMLMMIFLFSGCMAVAPEAIAGEKERGTIATLLVTPMKRSHLALGKIVSLSVIAILSGLSSFIGTMLSLPNMMGGAEDVNASVYQISDYLLLLAVILSTVLVIVSIVSIISAFAKNVKEATTWVTPVMIVVMLLAVTSMIDSMKPSSLIMYLIPLYNSVQSMNGVFSFSAGLPEIALTAGINVVYTFLCVGILTKMFNSEKVMFSR